MACADMIILNKTDLVNREKIGKITQWLDSRFHRYRLVEASHGEVPLEMSFSVGRLAATRPRLEQHDLGRHCCTDVHCDRESLS